VKILAFISIAVGIICGLVTIFLVPISIHLGIKHLNRVHENEISNKFFSILFAIIGIIGFFMSYYFCAKGYKMWQKY
jgi:uncharacterized BrkB/YihY/UPF0761 family membrane protein